MKLSRYATSLVSNTRHKMSKLLTGIAEDLEEECRAAMLHDSMDLSPGLWSMSSKWKKAKRGSTLGKGTGQGKPRRIIQGRVVLK